jgi:hypothetical protein
MPSTAIAVGSVLLSDKFTDEISIKAVHDLENKVSHYLVRVYDGSCRMLIINDQMEVLYNKLYPDDMFIIDFELMYHGKLLALLIEDNHTQVREVTTIFYETGEYVQSP